jgi:hypothetical protein
MPASAFKSTNGRGIAAILLFDGVALIRIQQLNVIASKSARGRVEMPHWGNAR